MANIFRLRFHLFTLNNWGRPFSDSFITSLISIWNILSFEPLIQFPVFTVCYLLNIVLRACVLDKEGFFNLCFETLVIAE